jgi:hypothetical protein
MRAPDTAVGKKIRCPACKTLITVAEAEDFVEPDEETAVSETPRSKKKKVARQDDEPEEDEYRFDEDDAEERRRRKKKRKREYDDDEYDRRMRRKRSRAPHRGVLILLLALASMLFFFFPLLCFVLAAVAERMAKTDLDQIDSGRMDPGGRGMTQAGQICAYAGALLGLLWCCGGGIFFSVTNR